MTYASDIGPGDGLASPSVLHAQPRRTSGGEGRLPLGFGLALGAVASIGLWAGLWMLVLYLIG